MDGGRQPGDRLSLGRQRRSPSALRGRARGPQTRRDLDQRRAGVAAAQAADRNHPDRLHADLRSVGSGFVESLAHPGGNITGFTLGEFSMGGKTLEALKEVAPQVSRVAVMLNLDQPPHVAMWRAIETVAPSFGVRLTAADAQDPAQIERAIEAFAREPNGGLIVLPGPIAIVHRDLIIALAARHRVPAAYGFRFFATSGGLMSYGVDPADQSRQAAAYVDRILKDAKPSDLPVQQPTKFELVINLKTAKAMGLNVPESVLARADEVIE